MTGAGATGATVMFEDEGSDGGRLLERVLVMVSIFCKRRLRSKNLCDNVRKEKSLDVGKLG
jgi:hypothetical protein